MTLRPSLIPLRLLLLLLLSGAVCRADAGFETESPVRTLQVETLVRRAKFLGIVLTTLSPVTLSTIFLRALRVALLSKVSLTKFSCDSSRA
uniref:Uncharacterized protein n=1 Tax=Ursus maritimus TaxID=29073 RepID=A0A452TK60_URSMA